MSEIQTVKKIGAKQILGVVSKVVSEYCAEDGDRITAYSVYGTANGIKTGTSTYGEWVGFVGNMGAINHLTGEKFEGAVAYIPEPLQSMLKNALANHESVEFAFSVDVKRRDDLKEGYEYLVKAHRDVAEADPLESLRSRIPNIAAPKKVNSLPAPETTGKTKK